MRMRYFTRMRTRGNRAARELQLDRGGGSGVRVAELAYIMPPKVGTAAIASNNADSIRTLVAEEENETPDRVCC